VVQAVESDVALVIAVLRIANRARSPRKGKIAAIPDAVNVLTPGGVEALASRTQVYDFFERTPVWDAAPERFPLHAVATQPAADAQPEATIVRLADMLAHHGHGLPVDPKQMSAVARSLDMSMEQLRSVMYELPYPRGDRRAVEPCPLSAREVEVLRRLRDGK